MVRGQPPKRSEQRRRRNAPEVPIENAPASATVPDDEPAEDAPAPSRYMAEPPPCNPMWHPIAQQWYNAVVEAGQAVYYVASDWSMAVVMADLLTRDYQSDDATLRTSTQNTLMKVSTALLLTEGDRRKARIELERARQSSGAQIPAPAPGNMVDLDAWRKLSGS